MIIVKKQKKYFYFKFNKNLNLLTLLLNIIFNYFDGKNDKKWLFSKKLEQDRKIKNTLHIISLSNFLFERNYFIEIKLKIILINCILYK